MCNRYRISRNQAKQVPEAYARQLAEEEMTYWDRRGGKGPTMEVSPSDLGVIMAVGSGGDIKATTGRWGLWRDFAPLLTLTRSENLTSSTWAGTRRCIVPMDEFYEWDGSHGKWAFRNEIGRPFWAAGLWEVVKAPDETRTRVSFSILTMPPPEQFRSVHDRVTLCLGSWEECEEYLADKRKPGDATSFVLEGEPEQPRLF